MSKRTADLPRRWSGPRRAATQAVTDAPFDSFGHHGREHIKDLGGSAVRVTTDVRTHTGDTARTVLITVVGEMDIANASRLLSAVIEATQAAPQLVVLDLSRVDYMDSSGLSEVLRAQHFAGSSGCGLRIRGATPAVRRLFVTTGVDQVVDLD